MEGLAAGGQALQQASFPWVLHGATAHYADSRITDLFEHRMNKAQIIEL
jgi:hypothetical protein